MTHLEFPEPGEPAHIQAHQHAQEVERRRRRWRRVALVAVVVLLLVAGLAIVWYLNHRPVEVPDLARDTTEEAREQLQSAGLNLGKTSEVPTDAVAAGRIVGQHPAPGIAVDEGSSVDVDVAVEPKLITMPDVTGVPESEAKKMLERAPLIPFRYEIYSAEVPKGVVAGQLPLAGAPVVTGGVAAYYVSLGNESGGVVVPDVVGLSAADATLIVAESGLDAEPFYENVATSGFPGEVLAQYPPGDARLPSNSPVAILISIVGSSSQ